MEFTNRNQIIEALKKQLETNPKQIEKSIIRIYEYQTKDEQNSKNTKHYNLVGFRSCDAHILSSFAQYLLKGYHLSEKQLNIAKEKMPIYARQLVNQALEKGLIHKENNKYIWG